MRNYVLRQKTQMRRELRNYKSDLKAKIAPTALKDDMILAELSVKYDVHQNQITEWKKQRKRKTNPVVSSTLVFC